MNTKALAELISIEIDASRDILTGHFDMAAGSLDEAARQLYDAGYQAKAKGLHYNSPMECVHSIHNIVQMQLDVVRGGKPDVLDLHARMLWKMSEFLGEQAKQGAPNPIRIAEAKKVAFDTYETVQETLADLLHGDSSFVQVELEGTDKFVQFANAHGRILLDLPAVALTAEEREKVEVYTARKGGTLLPWNEGTDADGMSYQIDFGQDASRASRACMDIIEEVYGASAEADVLIRID